MSISLIIDTSTERALVVFAQGGESLREYLLPFGYQSSQHIFEALKQGQEYLNKTDLEFIGIGIGPGSYTGLRVGAITAKTISFARGLPLVSFSSLDGFIPDTEGFFAAVIDAKIGGVYLQVGRKEGETITRVSPPKILSLEEAHLSLKDIPTIVTPHAEPLMRKMKGSWNWEERWPNSHYLTKLCRLKFKNNDFVLDQHLDLLYLRKTQAEIEKENNPA